MVEDQAILEDIAAVAKKLGVNPLHPEKYLIHGRWYGTTTDVQWLE